MEECKTLLSVQMFPSDKRRWMEFREEVGLQQAEFLRELLNLWEEQKTRQSA